MVLDSNHVTSLLKQYGIHVPVTDERFLSHAALDRGTALRIECASNAYGKQIILNCENYESTRFCPLGPDEAQSMVDDLHRLHLIPEHGQTRNTLAHLLMKCAELYVAEDLQRFTLAPVYLRENDYRIGAAEMAHAGMLEHRTRLAPEAHDKGAVFAYRRTARLKNVRKNGNET